MATICFVSLCMALYTTPKLPVPSFSNSVYWLAGLLLGIGCGPLRLVRGFGSCASFTGDDDGDFVMDFGCEAEPLLARLALRNRREFCSILGDCGCLRDEGEGDDRSRRANHASMHPHRTDGF